MSIGAIASVLYTEVVLWWEGPLQEAPLYYRYINYMYLYWQCKMHADAV